MCKIVVLKEVLAAQVKLDETRVNHVLKYNI